MSRFVICEAKISAYDPFKVFLTKVYKGGELWKD